MIDIECGIPEVPSLFWWIRIVSDSEPEREGIWIRTGLASHGMPGGYSTQKQESILRKWCPEGHHIVDMDTAPKGGFAPRINGLGAPET